MGEEWFIYKNWKGKHDNIWKKWIEKQQLNVSLKLTRLKKLDSYWLEFFALNVNERTHQGHIEHLAEAKHLSQIRKTLQTGVSEFKETEGLKIERMLLQPQLLLGIFH